MHLKRNKNFLNKTPSKSRCFIKVRKDTFAPYYPKAIHHKKTLKLLKTKLKKS